MSKSAILCVDDEVGVLESLEIELQQAFNGKYLCEFAESAAEALEIIEELCEAEVKILVIVSDWLMPGMKGDELLIKIHQKYPQIVTVMLTGQADKEAIERTKTQANLHAFIEKPWRNQELIEAIKSGLGNL
ncbi:response regulator receiver protein [Oscillatoria nigro-viridis PCC 7112]|uniref:Response regulator receiver protein n=1 Tax=Phormidium nigroviride PCC 7112 TaxID=179408 RepID=K9VR33_9CYAN|nr:response regulator [Oscillatoria nigro-viridis]AFZ10416.1 response regulator receiver protein [Oscillatoria nigro-viridis PCC 7112]